MQIHRTCSWLLLVFSIVQGRPAAAADGPPLRQPALPNASYGVLTVDRPSAEGGLVGAVGMQVAADEGSQSGPTTRPIPPLPWSPKVVTALTLGDLERIAMESNPTLVQARMAVSGAEGIYVQAGLYPNPVLGYIADEIGNDGSEGLQGAGVAQEIVTGGKLRLSRAVASHELQQAQCAFEAQRWRVINDVRAAYYEALLAQKTIEVNEHLLGIEEQLLKATQQLRGAKEVSEVDVLQARVETENAKLNLSEARDRHESVWRRLAAVLGRPDIGPSPLVGDATVDLPVITWDDALARLLSQSPELTQAQAGVERAQCELARQCAERIPNVEIGAAVKNDTGSGYTVVDLSLGMPLKIFDRNQGNIMHAQAALTSAQHEVRRIGLELRDRLATAFEQYVNSRRRAETYAKTIIPHARRSLDLTAAGYREGEFAYVALLTAQRTYYDTTLKHLSSLQDLWGRSVELEGMLLRGGLQSAAGD